MGLGDDSFGIQLCQLKDYDCVICYMVDTRSTHSGQVRPASEMLAEITSSPPHPTDHDVSYSMLMMSTWTHRTLVSCGAVLVLVMMLVVLVVGPLATTWMLECQLVLMLKVIVVADMFARRRGHQRWWTLMWLRLLARRMMCLFMMLLLVMLLRMLMMGLRLLMGHLMMRRCCAVSTAMMLMVLMMVVGRGWRWHVVTTVRQMGRVLHAYLVAMVMRYMTL